MDTYTRTTIAMLAVINPVVCVAILLDIQRGQTRRSNFIAAVKAMAMVLTILIIAAISGQYILNMFGISMDAFRAVGGIILAFIGFQMLAGLNSDSTSDSTFKKGDLTPLILFAASPGSIAMVMTLSTGTKGAVIPVATIIGICAAVIISMAIISVMLLISKNKKGGNQSIISRFMGLIIAAMGLQFLLDGLKNFFSL